ncbi:MAG: trypsin-like peptidase domain-containing protein [Saprospiraceae bacterium]|nr:trypsin-like peptidase domain-containing protein [Saprospiraceae bacterium]
MQNAQTLLLQTIEGLLEENEVDKALEALLELDKQADAGIRQDVILASGNYREASKQYQRQLISFEEYARFSARTRFALLELMKEVPKRVALNARFRNVSAYQFEVPDEVRLEKVLGQTSHILKIGWLEKARDAANAVCRVVCADGNLGTGFLTREGYVFTNHHVVGSAEAAKTARLEFNYEEGKSRTTYEVDAADFISSPPGEYDFARLKVIDRPDAPLRQWGFVEFEPDAIPALGEAVTIIQHPKGEEKQIALNANEVLGQLNQHLFYTTDTEPGSSGSPVFNKHWKVVAIHHAGKTDKEGGMVVNARGDRRGANRGILFRDIFKVLQGAAPKAGSVTSGGGGQESAQQTQPETTPVVATETARPSQPSTSPATAVSAVPKFVVVYDVADTPQCQALNKHLNILKITKKIRVYNVHEALPGEDPVVRATNELSDADYILALVTVNLFNAAEWFGMVYEAMEKGRRIIPIRIEKADIEGTGLEKMKSLPTMGRSISDFPSPDAAYTDVVGELKKLLPR